MSSTSPYESAQPAIESSYLQDDESTNNNLKSLLFSFRGRIPRRLFWGLSLTTALLFSAVMLLLALIGSEETAAIAGLLLYIPLVWISLALQVKRWHDRDKSGWWVLIGLVPMIGPLWAFVEAGCLRGSVGPNRFGADPT